MVLESEVTVSAMLSGAQESAEELAAWAWAAAVLWAAPVLWAEVAVWVLWVAESDSAMAAVWATGSTKLLTKPLRSHQWSADLDQKRQ